MNLSKPNRVARTYVQHLVAGPDRVFPLLCPVREADWIEGWDPVVVHSQSGVAETDCVFVTAAQPHDAIWTITRHEAQAGVIQMIKVTPGVTVCRLDIELQPAPAGTHARVTYTHTSLGPAGDEFIASFTEAHYQHFMQDWELRLNHYLQHGSALHLPAG